MRMSKLLKVSKVKHEELGEIIELYAPSEDDDGTGAYFINIESRLNSVVDSKTLDISNEDREVIAGVGIRLTKKTALKLSQALLKLAK